VEQDSNLDLSEHLHKNKIEELKELGNNARVNIMIEQKIVMMPSVQ
jgi:hypothetical protein